MYSLLTVKLHMSTEEALEMLYKLLQHEHLTDVHNLVFIQTWQGQTYSQMAESSGYESDYLKFVGYGLWRSLSQVCGQRVTKSNLQMVMRAQAKQCVKQNTRD